MAIVIFRPKRCYFSYLSSRQILDSRLNHRISFMDVYAGFFHSQIRLPVFSSLTKTSSQWDIVDRVYFRWVYYLCIWPKLPIYYLWFLFLRSLAAACLQFHNSDVAFSDCKNCPHPEKQLCFSPEKQLCFCKTISCLICSLLLQTLQKFSVWIKIKVCIRYWRNENTVKW